ncbi:hypothetical protein QT971_05005 [Microcoleus sp. herbarium19]|uniref:hypothetical protein n=1 Tax=Microcoleus sp. herbarium19 TaxID=3055440 RepID=UPI002FD2862F
MRVKQQCLDASAHATNTRIFGKLNPDQNPTNPPCPKSLSAIDRCLLFARNPHLVCAVHPAGPNSNTCIDFREDPNATSEELWEPEGASYYNGELILQPRQYRTPEELLQLVDTHPLFIGRCPRCEHPFPKYEISPVHWDCIHCGWDGFDETLAIG